MRLLFFAALGIALSTSIADGAIFTVTNTNDAGPGSLRQAIIDANADPAADTIAFNIPGMNVQTVAVLSPLPPIVNPVVIDGYTQPGSSPNTLAVGNNAELRIELNGASASAAGASRGIDIRASGCTIRGLVVNRFNSDGIAISSSGNHVAGCFVGTNATATAGAKNGAGVWIQPAASDNRIGGTAPADRNVISSNDEGIVVSDSTNQRAANNVIEGNHLGTDKTGTSALRHVFGAIVLDLARAVRIGGTAPGARNVIFGGIELRGRGGDINQPLVASSDNVIEGNFIDRSVSLGVACRNNRIGGAVAAAGNEILHVRVAGASENLIQGNAIRGGITIVNSGQPDVTPTNNLIDRNTLIGGSSPYGIEIRNGTSNVIQRNLIGVAANGNPVPYLSSGIYLIGGGGNVIGGIGPGSGNIIAHNGTAPFTISGISSQGGDRINGNSIYANGGLGIDIIAQSFSDAGPTKNDPAETDRAQNYPILTSAIFSGPDVRITGTLSSTANTSFRIELFANGAVDPSGYGEGQFYLGFTNVMTDAAGNASFDVTLPARADANVFSATATGATRGTSEFSPSFLLGKLENISTRARVQTGERVVIGGFIISGSEPRRVMFRGIGPSLEISAVPFAGRLEDPTLEVIDNNRVVVAANDNWRDTQQTEIEQTGIPPKHDREPAIVRSLAPGNYTAVLRGKNSTTGVGVVEVYDLDSDAVSRLANISTRAFVETGEKVMIGGFMIGRNDGRARVLIRGIGPSVPVSSGAVLQDPMLELYDASGVLLASNDDWKTNQAQIEATGAPPRNDRESALVADLSAGSYTAVLRGKGETTGVALVEVYHLQ